MSSSEDQADQRLEEAMTHESAINSDEIVDEQEQKELDELDNEIEQEAEEEEAAQETKVVEEFVDLNEGIDESLLEGDDEEEPAESSRPPKKHVNIVFIGHVDAGKSTISGHLMYLTGMLDDRTLEKYEREAEAKNRATWKYAWAVDTTEQERAKGKTEECGRAYFETEQKVFTILDAPGHKNFVPHMIGGASQADIGILVISARKGEFETGFENGGQTREHAMLAKTVGVKQLIVLINKMDSVDWAKERYDEAVDKLKPFLRKKCGYGKKDIVFMPCSGMSGANLLEPIGDDCTWYKGPTFLGLLDSMKPPERLFDAALRLPIAEKYKDMGTIVMGKLEAGQINVGDDLVMMPNKIDCKVDALFLEDTEIDSAEPGDNVKIRLRGIDEDQVHEGDVLCYPDSLVPCVDTFNAQFICLEYKSIICAGYNAVMHIHSTVVEVQLTHLIAKLDSKGKVIEKRPKFIRPGDTVRVRFKSDKPVCMETFKDFPQLGRFMIRDEGNTIGVGVVLKMKGHGGEEEEGQSSGKGKGKSSK
eukprot:TRINITY_DN631_c0_g1_i1.p1 TRINITY_DN631_c0_g1~~TRINITY_DN631_c0_g1_i1.p1  ORF type:complete len:533 (+),score=230.21 TRINITY_DN631_c0_g1_i1:2460-4058(+)